MFVNKTFFDGCRIFVVDDVATSMGTKFDLLAKIEDEARKRNMKFSVVGVGIAIDREQTTAVYDDDGKALLGRKGASAIQDFVSKSGIPVYSVAGIREVMEILYKKKTPVLINGSYRPMDEKTKSRFDDYIRVYGID